MSLTLEETFLIQMTPLFGNLPESTLQLITNSAVPRDYPKRKILFHEGDKADHFYVVLKGMVKLFRCSYDGNETVIHVFKRGEIFGESAMFMGSTFPLSAEVVSPARLLRIESNTIRRVIRKQPDIAIDMLASASRHHKQIVDQINQLKVHSVNERVAKFLLGLTAEETGQVQVDLPYEKSLIASTLGMKPESFSRALGNLRTIGVAIDHEHVVIEDVEKLKKFTGMYKQNSA